MDQVVEGKHIVGTCTLPFDTAVTFKEQVEFGKFFGDLWTTEHPDIAGEVKGKSSNTSWGAKTADGKDKPDEPEPS